MIKSLQSIRFVFALMIFIHHFHSPQIEQFGSFPVAFFFILSGFLLSMGYSVKYKKREFVYGKFVRKRLIRIFPLNWFSLMLALLIPFIVSLVNNQLSLYYYATLLPNVFLLQSWFPLKSVYFSGNAVAWFLSDILICYLLFPVLLRITSSKAKHLFMLIVVTLYGLLVSLIPDNLILPILYINPVFRMVDFIIGMYLYTIWRLYSNRNIFEGNFISNSFYEITVVLISVLFIIAYPYVTARWSYVSLFWIPSILLILVLVKNQSGGGILSKALSTSIFVYLGSLSFPFYMFHLTVIHWNRDLCADTCFEDGSFAGGLVCILITLLLSHLYSMCVEPFIDKMLSKSK